MTKYSLKLMKERDYGRILLIASVAGKEVYKTNTLCVYTVLFTIACGPAVARVTQE